MKEIIITTNKMAHYTGTSINVWRWEVPVYLFLGGVAAGIMVIAAYMIMKNRGDKYPLATNRIILAVPAIMSLGMLALFLDLEHKLYVWRFYTAFRVTSVMSWGAWILLLVYPFSILLILGTFRAGYPVLYEKLESFIKNSWLNRYIELFYRSFNYAEAHRKTIAAGSIPVGILLGVYTGILLSSLGARPFWNSAILGPLFLVSGLSTAVALIILLSRNKEESHFFTRLDLGLIGIELFILLLFIAGMLTSTSAHMKAIKLVLGGELTHIFWIFIFIIGLGVPACLEWLELKGKEIPGVIAASLVLIGGLLLRFIFVDAGQISTWLPY